MFFKNRIERYWRGDADSAVSRQERTHIRGKLLSVLGEPNHQVRAALQLGASCLHGGRCRCGI